MTVEQVDLSGRTCLVTGATSGIGRRAAESIARMGASVTLVGRNPDKTETAAQEIRSATGNQQVDYLIADLSSLGEVRKLAASVRARQRTLNLLVNNAGAMFGSRYESVDGYEMTLALNHLSYFLLTRELLGLLEAGSPSRIVSVASSAHKRGTIDFDDLQATRRYRPVGAYAQSKLANILFTYELARRLDGKGITANCVHPGFVRSGFGKKDGIWMKLGFGIAGIVARSPEKGSEGIVHLATSARAQGVTGKYYMDRRELCSNAESRDPDVQRRLWEVTETLVGH